MPTTINMTLSTKSIQNAIKQIEDYKKSLSAKCELLCQKLIEKHGIKTAKENVDNYGKYITFTMQTNSTKYGCNAVMVATNTGIIKSEWQTQDGVKTAEVSPLLMVEFGSGLRAKNPLNVPGVGTGTFPGGTHGEDHSGWWWMDLDGNWHHSFGQSPLMPMYNASLQMQMIDNIKEVAQEVFES